MRTILLSVGSNTFAKTNIDKAKRMLVCTFPDVVFSEPILTEPIDERYIFPFRNILAKFESDLPTSDIVEKTKMIERAVGRSPRDKYLGRVIIDIDLIKCGEEVLRPKDYGREYIQELLNRI